MRKKFLILLSLIAFQVEGYMSVPSGPSSSVPSTTTTTPTKKPPKKYTKPLMRHPRRARQFVSGEQQPRGPLFYHPGMIWVQNGQWVGADNFTNISKTMALQVNLIKPGEMPSPVNEETIRSKIAAVFGQSGINLMQGAGDQGMPPLPLFEMQVMIFPVKDGYAAACFSHLFEEAPPRRLRLVEGEIFQAITWQQANLVVSPLEGFEKLLLETVDTIARSFVKRLATYQAPPAKTSPGEVLLDEPLPN